MSDLEMANREMGFEAATDAQVEALTRVEDVVLEALEAGLSMDDVRRSVDDACLIFEDENQ